MRTKSNSIHLIFAMVGAFSASSLFFSAPANGEPVSLNYDTLAFIEKPVAKKMKGFTLTHKQLVDLGIARNMYTNANELRLRGTFELGVERQLKNAWTLGATYNLSYKANPSALVNGTGIDGIDLTHRAAGYVGGVFGRVSAGSVTEMTKELTRRLRGTGNAELQYDGPLGAPNHLGLSYKGRLSAFTGVLAVDYKGRFDVGVAYERPARKFDQRYTLRLTSGDVTSADGRDHLQTLAATLVGEVIRGRLRMDASLGVEQLDGSIINEKRFWLSAGAGWKFGRFTVSGEGTTGWTGGQQDWGVALGGRYDIAKGMSINLGINHHENSGAIHGVQLYERSKTEVILSARYEY